MTDRQPESHARLAASSAHRWMNCAGSPRMEAGRPDVDTEYNVEGRAAHALAARLLEKRNRFSSDDRARSFLSGVAFMTVELKEGGDVKVAVTDEMRDALVLYASVVREAIEEAAPPVRTFVEQRVSLEKLDPPEKMFGTADFALAAPGLIHVIDLKYGTGVVVEVRDNPQLMEYALATKLSLPTADVAGLDPEIRTTIVQPRASHPDGAVRSHSYSLKELREFGHKLIEAAKRAHDPAAALTPGSWCRWCKAAAFCPALARETQAAAQAEFDTGLTPGTAVVVSRNVAEVVVPDVELLPIATIARVLEKAEMIEGFLAAARERARRELMGGREVPGWKLVNGRAMREWIEDAEEKLKAIVDPKELYETKLRSPAQIEKLIGKKNLPAALYRKVSKSIKLAPSDDPRPAIASSAQDEFAALPPVPDSNNSDGKED
jgi:uncharacterized protein DUF2800